MPPFLDQWFGLLFGNCLRFCLKNDSIVKTVCDLFLCKLTWLMVNWSVRKRYLKCIQLCNFVEFWHFYMKVWEDRKTVCLANCFVWTATTSCRTNKRLSNKINKRKYLKENKSWDKRSHTQTQVTKHNLTHTHTYCTHISIRLTARYIVTNI